MAIGFITPDHLCCITPSLSSVFSVSCADEKHRLCFVHLIWLLPLSLLTLHFLPP